MLANIKLNSFKKTYTKILLLVLVLAFINGLSVSADTYESTNFQVLDPVIGAGANRGTSDNYILWQSLGEIGLGKSTASNFELNSGFLTWSISSPTPTGGGGAYFVIKNKVIFEGKAYPDSLVTILKDAKVMAVVQADSKADFRAEVTDLTAGNYTFGLWAEDNEGRKSVTISFTINVSSLKTTTISDILLPSTIELEKISLEKGEFLNISGQTVPGSDIDIFIGLAEQEIVEKTKAETDGKWSYSFDTAVLNKGIYSVKAKTISLQGLISSFSEILMLYYIEEASVGEICPRGDLNQDSMVNLVDFSILLYWWGRVNTCADQNRNGIVDLPDFSMMMYYWTG